MRPPLRRVLGLALVAATLAGCGATSDHAVKLTLESLDTPTPTAPPSPAPPNVECK